MKSEKTYKPTDLTLSAFCDSMAMMLKAGISVSDALEVLETDAADSSERDLIKRVREEEQTTYSFEKALEETGAFPPYMVHMAALGEQTGNLDVVMTSLAEYYLREDSLKRSLKNAFVFPSVMVGMMLVVIGVLLTKVMPVFERVYAQLGTQMTGLSRVFMKIGDALRANAVVLVILAGILLVLALLGLFTEKGRKKAEALGKKIPAFRDLSFLRASCRLAGGMSMALRSGLDSEEALNLCAKLNEDAAFGTILEKVLEEVREGTTLSAAFEGKKLFPAACTRLILVGGKTGTVDEAMARTALLCEEEMDDRINRMMSVLEPVMVIAISVIVGVILLSVMLPLTGIVAGL